MQKSALDKLLATTPSLWKGRRPNHAQHTLPSGHANLDARLPGGGWPVGAVTELITPHPGLGELSLLLPALAEMGRRGQWLLFVDPPWVPYPAALQAQGLSLERLLLIRTRDASESLWACEQALCNGRGGAVLAWPERIGFTRLRRLQLAAQENGKSAFLYRPREAREQASPAALRLFLETEEDQCGTRVSVLKCRGSHPSPPTRLRLSTFANPAGDTGGHETLSPAASRTLLAGHTPAAPGPGPAHPRAEHEVVGRGGDRVRPGPRTDH